MKAYLRITKQRCKPLAAEIFQKSPKTMQLSVNNIFSFRFPGEDCDVPARWCAIPPRLSQNHRCKNRSRCGCLTISLARFKESRDGAVAQLVERIVRNDEVRGSIPLGSTATLAQLVEHVTRNDGVVGSTPTGGSVLPLGVTGNTPDSGSGESRFEP